MQTSSAVAVVIESEGKLAALSPLIEQAEGYALRARAENTERAYRGQWKIFTEWCSAFGLESLPAPPAVVALFFTARAGEGKTVATLKTSAAAVTHFHTQACYESPCSNPKVVEVLAGIRRGHGRPQKQANAITLPVLRKLVSALGQDLNAVRDRALLLIGWAGGFRRSELCALDVSDVAEDPDGLTITVRRGKTDQEGKGRQIAVPYGSSPSTCPVRSWRTWAAARGVAEGPAFVSVRYGRVTARRLGSGEVSRILKRLGKLADVPLVGLSAHGLRSGLCTEASRQGKSMSVIMGTTGHRSVQQAQSYIRSGRRFEDAASAGLGL